MLGEPVSRPVRFMLTDQGKLKAADGSHEPAHVTDYEPGKWLDCKIGVHRTTCRYRLKVNGRDVLNNAGFPEPSSVVYAISFASVRFCPAGPYRERSTSMAQIPGFPRTGRKRTPSRASTPFTSKVVRLAVATPD